jgi:hypothetical protein
MKIFSVLLYSKGHKRSQTPRALKVVNINIRDNADEFRVEVTGRFAGSVVDDVLYLWKTVLLETNSRRFIIDISQLTGYDYAGCTLLRDMHLHGAHISASTSLSLVYLNEISGTRKLGPALVRKSPQPEEAPRSNNEKNVRPFPLARAAGSGV